MATAINLWTDLEGYAVAHRMGYLQELPIDQFCSFVWWMLTKNGDQREVDKLRARLWQPPLGEVVTDPRSPWSPQAELDSLAAFKRGMGGKPTLGLESAARPSRD